MSNVIIVKANNDKTTVNKYRYIIQENKFGIQGTIYIDKSNYEENNHPKTIKMKIKLSD